MITKKAYKYLKYWGVKIAKLTWFRKENCNYWIYGLHIDTGVVYSLPINNNTGDGSIFGNYEYLTNYLNK